MTPAPVRTLLHASDLHFGKAFDSLAARAFTAALQDASPDLLVLSGDFTQRAKVGEYRQARDFIRGLSPLPVVVTPGNHDVPLYRVWERLLAPLRNYRSYIAGEVDTLTQVDGVTIVGLSSPSPYGGIVNGRILRRQLRFAERAFREAREGDLRVLVTHHHLVPPPDGGPSVALRGARRCLQAFSAAGVELILGGHAHRGWVGTFETATLEGGEGHRIVLAYSGTTTSRRGRVGEEKANSFNRIRVSREQVEITRFLRREGEEAFSPLATHSFSRFPEGGA